METLGLALLEANPKLYFFLVSSLFVLLIFLFHKNYLKSQSYPVNWPLVGMFPHLLLNYYRLHYFVTRVLALNGGTKEFRGPWFSGMNFVMIGDPINANHVTNHNFSNYPKGEEYHEIFDILGEGIFRADADSWKVQRKMAQALVTSPRFRSFIISCTQEKVEKGLLPFLNRMVEIGEPFDLQDVFTRLTHDTTSILVFGVDPGCLGVDLPTLTFAKALDDAEEVLLFRHLVPMFWWKLLRWLRVKQEKKMAEAWAELDNFINHVIKERRAHLTAATTKTDDDFPHLDLLSLYMNSESDSESDYYKSDKLLRDTMLTFLAAGKDTTGSALTWFFWLVTTNRHVEAKILQELQGTEFSVDEMGKFVYLHAAICETLRLYPSVPFNHKKAVRADVLPSGQHINAGMLVLISPYAMGRMEGVWGKDCYEFKPERWISEEGKLRHEPSYKLFAFNTGPRTCLGKNMAFTQLKIVAAAMLSNFRFELVEGHVVEPKLSIIIHMKNGLMMRLKKRSEA